MTWQIVQPGTNRTFSTSTLSATPPILVMLEAGDLIICYASWKNTSDMAIPAGWTLIGKHLGGTDDTTSDTQASGLMAYTIYDGVSIDTTFTLDVGVNGVAVCTVYRHTDGVAFDVGGIEAAAASTNSFGLAAGLTTSAPNCLIVAAGCSGRNSQITDYSATDPSIAAGSTDTSTPPTADTWIRRYNINSSAGSDYGTGHADGVKATAGPTGPITASVYFSHRPVMIAAAFRPAGGSGPAPRKRLPLLLTPW